MATNYRAIIGDGKCVSCHRPLGSIFWRLRIDRGVINVGAARRQVGLAMFLGSDELAEVMGPGETLVRFTSEVDEKAITTLCICDRCVLDQPIDLALQIEAASDREKRAAENTEA
jgi:hypothetical protein